MISLKNVSKVLGNKSVLSNITLDLQEGICYFLKGHNGSGKTMLLRLICGLISPTDGELTYDKKDLLFGAIIENPAFLENETAMYNLKFLSKIRNVIDEKTILECLETFDLAQNKDDKVKTFSLGMKQRLAIVQAIMENPYVLLFDEPFNALDEKNMETFLDIVRKEKEKNKIIVIASHYIDERVISLCDKVYTIENGSIC